MIDLGLPRSIVGRFVHELRTVPLWDTIFVLFWIAGPLIYLIERTPADIWLSLIGIGFIAHSIRTGSWGWLATGWVRLIALFWGIMLVASALSSDPSYALGEAVAWLRFPLYAAACVFWIGTNRIRLNMMMLMMVLASVVMFVFLAVEFVDVVRYGNDAGGRLGGPYGDPLPGSFLGKAMLPLGVMMCALAVSLSWRAAILPLLMAGALVLFTLITGERVNTLLISLTILFAAFAWHINPLRLCIYGLTAIAILLAAMQTIPTLSDRYDPERHQEVTNYFDSPYWFSVRPGIVAALENPITGIGVGMHRIECATIANGPDWLHGRNECHPHPHQFYVQIAEETGLLGLIVGIAAITAMILSTAIGTHKQSIYARLAWIPVAMVFFPQPSADFFGQWNNLFLWFAVGLAMAMARDKQNDI